MKHCTCMNSAGTLQGLFMSAGAATMAYKETTTCLLCTLASTVHGHGISWRSYTPEHNCQKRRSVVSMDTDAIVQATYTNYNLRTSTVYHSATIGIWSKFHNIALLSQCRDSSPKC